nr:unnamed protein product [Callosobruchus chinensis]
MGSANENNIYCDSVIKLKFISKQHQSKVAKEFMDFIRKSAISQWKRSRNSQSTNKSHVESKHARKLNLKLDNKTHLQEKLMKWKEAKQMQYELARIIETDGQIEKKELIKKKEDQRNKAGDK